MNKIKENLSLIIVSVATIIYLLFIFKATELREFIDLELNAKGDFLAGVFAPLAFLWLVFGYYQQGQELKQNTVALRLQAHELKNAVDEQKRLNEIHEQNTNQKHFEVEPIFDVLLLNKKYINDNIPIYDVESGKIIDERTRTHFYFELTIKQKFNKIRNIEIVDLNEKKVIGYEYSLSPDDKFTVTYVFNEDEINYFLQGEIEHQVISINFYDIYGKKYSRNFRLTVSFSNYNQSVEADLEELIN